LNRNTKYWFYVIADELVLSMDKPLLRYLTLFVLGVHVSTMTSICFMRIDRSSDRAMRKRETATRAQTGQRMRDAHTAEASRLR
jgi:hypothetical protein